MRFAATCRRRRGGSARVVGMVAAFITLAIGPAISGCGLGAGEDTGDAGLLVTRDYGSEVLVDAPDLSVNESSDAMGLLDQNAKVETAYGGEYVQSVDGISGGTEKGRSFDWFFAVNGIFAERGSAQVPVKGGDVVWWDFRDWTDAMEVGAVVGAYPAPFSTGYDNRDWGIEIDCLGKVDACSAVENQLEDDGAEIRDRAKNIILRVGTWDQVRGTAEGRRIARGADASGVFARFDALPTGRPADADAPEGAWSLTGLKVDGESGQEFGPEAGLVAAMRRAEDPPVWLITGGTEQAVEAAAAALDPEILERRYAAVVDKGTVTSLPLP